jgi:hypothetical protein
MKWDIFYYLGEFMLGAKGFIGLGLESMYDNLINVSSICNLSQVVVKFSSFDKISGVVGPEYLDRLIEILKEYEIQVEIV